MKSNVLASGFAIVLGMADVVGIIGFTDGVVQASVDTRKVKSAEFDFDVKPYINVTPFLQRLEAYRMLQRGIEQYEDRKSVV